MSLRSPCLAWEYRVPVLTNAFLWYDLAKVCLIVYLVGVALMSVAFLAAGEPGSVVCLRDPTALRVAWPLARPACPLAPECPSPRYIFALTAASSAL